MDIAVETRLYPGFRRVSVAEFRYFLVVFSRTKRIRGVGARFFFPLGRENTVVRFIYIYTHYIYIYYIYIYI